MADPVPPFIPIYRPDLSGREREYVEECLTSTWISSKGRFIGDFESAFADYVGASHAAACSNGTVALHLALLALGIGPGDEVIVPTLTYIASVNAIRYVGATPIFCDSGDEDWQADPVAIEAQITSRTRAIMIVHLYGGAVDVEAIGALARRRGLFIVEDCAEAIGTRVGKRHVGTFGDIATFSFFGNKTITTGEGGMVVTADPALHRAVCHFKGQGLAEGREYWHDVVGYNYRMTNICAAIGLAQFERIEHFLVDKARVAAGYRKRLGQAPVTFQASRPGTTHSHWMVTLTVAHADDRDPLRAALGRAGIETRPVFFPIHTMPMYRSSRRAFPVADDIAARGFNLPSWPGLADADLDRICASVLEYLRA
ncbi:MAG: DegT/DnrJ/EryC1/StrS family aminotransferase [Novosphingobium sp.]